MTETATRANDIIRFSNEERLLLENIQLKLELLEAQQRRLLSEKNAIGARIAEAHGVDDIGKYMINLREGVARRMEGETP